jgi:hypothetical protein
VPGGVWRGGGYVVEVHRGWAELGRRVIYGLLLSIITFAHTSALILFCFSHICFFINFFSPSVFL